MTDQFTDLEKTEGWETYGPRGNSRVTQVFRKPDRCMRCANDCEIRVLVGETSLEYCPRFKKGLLRGL